MIWLAGLTIFHLAASCFIPPASDELYYWSWAKDLQLSYYDHPPLTATLIALSTAIFGDNLFGIRFFSCLFACAILFLLGEITPRKQLLACLMFTPVFLFGGLLMTPDAPFLFFWTSYVWWLIGINETLRGWSDDPISRVYRQRPIYTPRWALGGLILGLGILSKYSMVLAIPCTFICLWSKVRKGAWIGGFAFQCFIAFCVALPILIFNIEHRFTPLAFQWNHSMASSAFSFANFFDFVGSQIVLVGALPLLLLAWLCFRYKELSADPVLHVCFWLSVPPFLFFLYRALGTKLEANWALMAYITFWPMAQMILDRSSFRAPVTATIVLGFLVPWGTTLLIGLHSISPFRVLIPEKDRLHRMFSQYAFSKSIAAELKEKSEIIYTTDYQWCSHLRFQGIKAVQLPGVGRGSQFTLIPIDPCQYPSILLFTDIELTGNPLKCFTRTEIIKHYTMESRGKPISRLKLIQYFK